MKKTFLNYKTTDGAIFTKDKHSPAYSPSKKNSESYEVSKVELWPVIRVCSILFWVMGILVGILAFLVFPHPSSAGLSFSTRFLSAILFAFLYAAILTAGISLFIWLYNIFASNLGWGIRLFFSQHSENEE